MWLHNKRSLKDETSVQTQILAERGTCEYKS